MKTWSPPTYIFLKQHKRSPFIIMPLTTAAKVRARLGVRTWEGDDAAITQFIADAEATITGTSGVTYTAADDDYDLAASLCTNIAAQQLLLALINPPESKPDPEKTMLYLASLPEFTNMINRDLALLVKRVRLPDKEIPLARNSIR